MTATPPNAILFAQHGWADDHRTIASLAHQLADSNTLVVAPSLGFFKTWIRIEPLIQAVENLVVETSIHYPDLPLRIVGHSMGGLIWLEVLTRHPEWCSRVESLVLVGSPIGGADLARLLDPFGWGIGIAADLGKSRRLMAEAIAAQIPTLVIAGDVDSGSDGTVPVQSTKVFGADFVRLNGITHVGLKNHPAVAAAIRQFWAQIGLERPAPKPDRSRAIVQRLQALEGMTDCHERDFAKAQVCLTFKDGHTLRLWKHPMGLDHVFVACPEGTCLYGGFVGWFHTQDLRQLLKDLEQEQARVR